MTQYVIGTPEFIKNLDGWLFENDQKFAKYIKSKKSGIPPMFTKYNQKLYRGMIVNDDFISNLTQGVPFNTFTSWSKDRKTAMGFVNDPKFRIATKEGIPILMEKKIQSSKVIFDIHAFILFMGEDQLEMLGLGALSMDSSVNEQEVLIDKGIKIVNKDIHYI